LFRNVDIHLHDFAVQKTTNRTVKCNSRLNSEDSNLLRYYTLWTGTNCFEIFYTEDGGIPILRIVGNYLSVDTQRKIQEDMNFNLNSNLVLLISYVQYVHDAIQYIGKTITNFIRI
jgi:hypothetical protein